MIVVVVVVANLVADAVSMVEPEIVFFISTHPKRIELPAQGEPT